MQRSENYPQNREIHCRGIVSHRRTSCKLPHLFDDRNHHVVERIAIKESLQVSFVKIHIMCDNLEGLTASLGANSNALSQLQVIGTALKRKQLSGSNSCAKATVEILRVFLGVPQLKTAEQMMGAVRVVGKELSQCAPSELTVGNIVRRVMQIIREEYSNKKNATPDVTAPQAPANSVADKTGDITDFDLMAIKERRGRKERSGSLVEQMLASEELSSFASSCTRKTSSTSGEDIDMNGMAPVRLSRTSSTVGENSHHSLQQPSLGSVLGAWASTQETSYADSEYSQYFPDMRQSVMGAVNELNDEIDSIFGPICEQAAEHIHSDDCILAHGWSHVVELFLKAAGRKRKYQVIVAEAEPDLSGHKLALALSKIPNISVTLIPDSAIYAIIGRVNKVVLAPSAVLADGGAMYSAGHAMVTVAAKEHNVPVVGLAAAFHLTPMFAHNQSETLGQLLSPSLTIAYNANVCQENVEVVNPAYDFVSPDLMSLYVTNNGSHQPSYTHRVLAELYHQSDHGALL